jgi:hypothetical protein
MRKFRFWLAVNLSRFYQFVATGTFSRKYLAVPNNAKITNFPSFIFVLQMLIDVGKIRHDVINGAFLMALKERSHPDITFEQFCNMLSFSVGEDREEINEGS